MDVVTLGAALSIMKKMPDTAASSAAAAEDAADRAEAAAEQAEGAIEVDDTLSVKGRAADAKETGKIKTDLDNVISLNPLYYISETISGTRLVDKSVNIPAGTYRLHIDSIVSSDTDGDKSVIAFYAGNTAVRTLVRNREVEIDEDITLSSDVNKITLYAGGSYPSSEGDTFTFNNFSVKKNVPLYTEINKKLETISIDDLPDKTITQDKLSFATTVVGINLFDYTSEDMCKPDYWYYGTSIGAVISPTQSQYTINTYHALTIPVYDAETITLGLYPATPTTEVYWVGAVDADMKLLSYQTINSPMPITYTLPEGTVYFLASLKLSNAGAPTYLPRIMAVSGTEITKYVPYEAPYYFLEDCKAEAEKPEEIVTMQTILGADENTVKLCLPDAYDLVVGDTFEMFYKGIVNAVNTDIYDVVVDCSKGSAYAKKFVITPTIAETLTMAVTLYGINHNVLDSKTVSLRVHGKANSPSSAKNILCVGDSLTTGGVWPKELYRRLTASDGTPQGDGLNNINFIGTRVLSGVHYEGYGGWSLNSYNNESVNYNARIITCTHDKTEAEDQHSIYKDSSNTQWKLETIESGQIKIIAVTGEGREFSDTGTLTWVSGGVNHSDIVYTAQTRAAGNPFWDSTAGKVDFASYASRLGVSGIDFVYVLIGWNSAGWSESEYKTSAQTFIDNVHTSYPNAKIIFVGLEIPARDGLGANYGATGVYSKYYGLMQFVFNLDKWYEEIASNNSNVYHVNLAGQFDTEHNMSVSTRPVNVRNSQTEEYQSNGVHPATSGFMQIADAVYRDITARL